MTDIQRYFGPDEEWPNELGDLVRYEDHISALKSLRADLDRAKGALEMIANSNPRDQDMFDLPSIARDRLKELSDANR